MNALLWTKSMKKNLLAVTILASVHSYWQGWKKPWYLVPRTFLKMRESFQDMAFKNVENRFLYLNGEMRRY